MKNFLSFVSSFVKGKKKVVRMVVNSSCFNSADHYCLTLYLKGVTQGEYIPMEDSEETSQSLPIDFGPLQSDQQNTTSSQECQGKRDDVIVIDSDDEEDDDEENDGEAEVMSTVFIFLFSMCLRVKKQLFSIPKIPVNFVNYYVLALIEYYCIGCGFLQAL